MSTQVYSPFFTITTSPYLPRGRQLHQPSYTATWCFSANGAYGVRLDGKWENMDGKHDEFFGRSGTKIAYQLLVDGYPLFTKQMNAQRRRQGMTQPIPRMKVVKQIAQVVQQFIVQAQSLVSVDGRLVFGPGFLTLEQIYLLELRQISQASFQPILGIVVPQNPSPTVSISLPQSEFYGVDNEVQNQNVAELAHVDPWWFHVW